MQMLMPYWNYNFRQSNCWQLLQTWCIQFYSFSNYKTINSRWPFGPINKTNV